MEQSILDLLSMDNDVFTSVSLTQLDIKGYRRPFVNQYQSILLVSVLVLVFTLHALDYKSHVIPTLLTLKGLTRLQSHHDNNDK